MKITTLWPIALALLAPIAVNAQNSRDPRISLTNLQGIWATTEMPAQETMTITCPRRGPVDCMLSTGMGELYYLRLVSHLSLIHI